MGTRATGAPSFPPPSPQTSYKHRRGLRSSGWRPWIAQHGGRGRGVPAETQAALRTPGQAWGSALLPPVIRCPQDDTAEEQSQQMTNTSP